MATLLQQRTVGQLASHYGLQYGLLPHKAFLFMVIEKFLPKLELNSIDIEESIIDGSDDCGIDAIVIDDETELRPRIYFFQSKFYQSENSFEKHFEGSALEKIQGAIRDFVLGGKINKNYQNQRLVDKLHTIRNLGSRNPRYCIVLCSNSSEPSTGAKNRLEDFINDINRDSAGDYLSVEYLHLDRIARELIAPQQKKRIDFDLQFSGKYLTEDTGNVRLFVGAVEAKDLAELVERHGDDLFERNVRGYLKQNNEVNKNIYKTAVGEYSPYFVYMNNGLTVTCEKFTHSPLSSSPTLKITNAQVVNGQQTARSISQANRENKLKPDVKVLVRLVETTDRDLLMEIVEATNNQTRVTTRDLHSNDDVQKLIENFFATQGYFYESRKNKYQGKEGAKRVDAEVAAQCYYAVFFEQPAVAKDKKKLLFGDKYDELFNDGTNPDKILYSFRLFKAVQKKNNVEEHANNFTFLKDATLHTAALMHRLCTNGGAEEVNFDEKSFEASYTQTVGAIQTLVQERVKSEGDKYEHRRTFKDPETFGRIVEILLR